MSELINELQNIEDRVKWLKEAAKNPNINPYYPIPSNTMEIETASLTLPLDSEILDIDDLIHSLNEPNFEEQSKLC